MEVIVQHCRQQIMRRANSVHVSCEVKINIFHRQNLRTPPASCTAFHPKNRAHGWFSDCSDSFFSNAAESLSKSYSSCRFPFTSRSWSDGGDKYNFPLFRNIMAGYFPKRFITYFSLIVSIKGNIISNKAQFFSNINYRSHFNGPGYCKVIIHKAGSPASML